MDVFVRSASGFVWGTPLVLLCIGAGIAFSLGTKFVQVRYFKEMIRQILGTKGKKDGGISPFGSLMLSLSGRLGTGNIAGVATAIAMGGPGAVFWMWLIAFLGAGSAFAEATLGQIFKIKDKDGGYRGGPSYYIEKGLGLRWYAVLYSLAIMLAYIIFLPGVQANTITTSMEQAFGFPPTLVGLCIVFSLLLLLRGGIKGFTKFSNIVIPVMTVGYILICLIIIAINIHRVPEVFMLIISSAFGANEMFGGVVGYAISYGVRRGVFSTEAGQGSQVSAAAAAETSHPVKQGLVQSFSIYIDTFLVNTATSFMILITGAYNVLNPRGAGYIVENIAGADYASPEFTIHAVDSVFSGFGSIFITIAVFFFVYTVFVTYFYVAETNLLYVTRGKAPKFIIWVMQVVFLVVIFVGSVSEGALAWALADIGVGMAVWINLVAILLLWKPLMICFKDYERAVKAGKEPRFNGKKLGIKNSDFWDS